MGAARPPSQRRSTYPAPLPPAATAATASSAPAGPPRPPLPTRPSSRPARPLTPFASRSLAPACVSVPLPWPACLPCGLRLVPHPAASRPAAPSLAWASRGPADGQRSARGSQSRITRILSQASLREGVGGGNHFLPPAGWSGGGNAPLPTAHAREAGPDFWQHPCPHYLGVAPSGFEGPLHCICHVGVGEWAQCPQGMANLEVVGTPVGGGGPCWGLVLARRRAPSCQEAEPPGQADSYSPSRAAPTSLPAQGFPGTLHALHSGTALEWVSVSFRLPKKTTCPKRLWAEALSHAPPRFWFNWGWEESQSWEFWEFPIAAVTGYHKPSGLKQHEFVILTAVEVSGPNGLNRATSKVLGGLCFFWRL